jgi:hypothetical protein
MRSLAQSHKLWSHYFRYSSPPLSFKPWPNTPILRPIWRKIRSHPVFKTLGTIVRRLKWELFVEILLYMGLCFMPRIKDYWSSHKKRPIQSLMISWMGCKRWEQIKRYLRISNLLNDKKNTIDTQGPGWWKKAWPVGYWFSKCLEKVLVFWQACVSRWAVNGISREMCSCNAVSLQSDRSGF